jgi:MazG family protein
MKEFTRLIEISEKLLGPGGCSWDKEQTLYSLQPYLLEEAHELIEAIDAQNGEWMAEELGDVLYSLIFIANLASHQKKFTIEQALNLVSEKLIRRHPHVFGDVQVNSTEDIVKNWEQIKKQEKGKEKRGLLDGIPPTLPTLARAQKIAKRLKPKGAVCSEEEIGEALWRIINQAAASDIDAESALRRHLEKVPEISSLQE